MLAKNIAIEKRWHRRSKLKTRKLDARKWDDSNDITCSLPISFHAVLADSTTDRRHDHQVRETCRSPDLGKSDDMLPQYAWCLTYTGTWIRLETTKFHVPQRAHAWCALLLPWLGIIHRRSVPLRNHNRSHAMMSSYLVDARMEIWFPPACCIHTAVPDPRRECFGFT